MSIIIEVPTGQLCISSDARELVKHTFNETIVSLRPATYTVTYTEIRAPPKAA